MATQKAIVLQGLKKAALVTDRPIPKLRPGYILVDVKAVALNPTDWKHREFLNTPGCLSGCDYAGLVAEVGTGYTKKWQRGDRICGVTHGANSLQQEDGAFAEKVVVKADVQMRIPNQMSFEDACTLGVAMVTVAQGLYQGLHLNLPTEPTTSGEPVLIYGGSSAMGTIGIQFAKLSGYTPITACSPKNFDLVKSMGAVEVFDYRAPDCAEQIKKYTSNNLKLLWDSISSDASVKICSNILAPGGIYGALDPVKLPRDDVKLSHTLAYLGLGEPVEKRGTKWEDNAKDFEFFKGWVPMAESLLAEGKIKIHPTRVGKGLEGVLDGMDFMKEGKVSGAKLVYTI
ncbi:hypothetical protein BP6252_10746 [Coleophoma cylindrospora]|uniref:Enoyl reductase (ER) domain-containing protein n=1 Tax=Coleophoma cylindrospora TaxID=1849047 RepID=A0A3D8QTI5_9HELO|nr:hypothetical protein BP6252_10746 [Coleophoma cylindrospora]